MYKAVLFDLDGVICDTAKFHYLAWKELANKLGGDIDEEFNELLKGVDRRESLNRILKEINVELNEEEIEKCMVEKNSNYLKLLEQLTAKDILPGISKLFDDLIENDVKISIASASKNAPVILEKIGLMDKVDAIADPGKVKLNKPDPEIFLLAAEIVDVDKSLCIGIEDSQAGLDALMDGGIDSVAIGDVLNGATTKLSDTSQLTYDVLLETYNRSTDAS